MKRGLLIAGMVVGSLLALGPVVGLLGMMFGMTNAYHTLGQSGVSDPRALAQNIGTAMMFGVSGLFLLPFGLVVLVLSVVFFMRLKPETPPALPGRD